MVVDEVAPTDAISQIGNHTGKFFIEGQCETT